MVSLAISKTQKGKEKLDLREDALPLKLENLDFRFENTAVKVIANKNHPEIKLAGFSVGPLQEGNEYELYFWVASELAAQGIVHFRESDTLDATVLYKTQWKERVQTAGLISELQEDFYPKLRRHLETLKNQVSKQPEKITEYEKAKTLACDIVNNRLKKIVSLSAAPTQTDQFTKKLTAEEHLLFDQLVKLITAWRRTILETQTDGENQ
jgi:hypothetical protein